MVLTNGKELQTALSISIVICNSQDGERCLSTSDEAIKLLFVYCCLGGEEETGGGVERLDPGEYKGR
jgi:hypothetical protein